MERKFDIAIRDLSIESSADKLDRKNKAKTTNIINAIMPFDTDKCVQWNANYLKGYSSEKRDVNIDQLEDKVLAQSKDIAKFKINDTLKKYNRGVRWDRKDLDLQGQQWRAAYLPVWLYSYREEKGDKSLLHYVAVNGRTKETMGSVPIDMTKLFIVSALIEVLGVLLMIFIDFGEYSNLKWLLLAPGLAFFVLIYARYRNTDARHSYEVETLSDISNLEKRDEFIRHERGLRSEEMVGANNRELEDIG